MWGARWTSRCFFFCSNAIKWRHISHHVVIKWYPRFHSLPSSMSIPCKTCVCLWGRWKARALKHKEDDSEPSWTSRLCRKWLPKHVIIFPSNTAIFLPSVNCTLYTFHPSNSSIFIFHLSSPHPVVWIHLFLGFFLGMQHYTTPLTRELMFPEEQINRVLNQVLLCYWLCCNNLLENVQMQLWQGQNFI